jgi:hypothetical protein
MRENWMNRFLLEAYLKPKTGYKWEEHTDDENEEMADHVIGKLAEIKTIKKEKSE